MTKLITYKRERVRFTFLALDKTPPFERWKIIGAQDPIDNSVLTAKEALRRLDARAQR